MSTVDNAIAGHVTCTASDRRYVFESDRTAVRDQSRAKSSAAILLQTL